MTLPLSRAAMISGLCAIALLSVSAIATEANRPNEGTEVVPNPEQVLSLTEGDGQLVRLSVSAASLFVGDPEIADVRPVTQSTVYVFARGVGSTSFYALDADERVIASYHLQVNIDPAPEQAAIEEVHPESEMKATSAGEAKIFKGDNVSIEEAATLEALARAIRKTGKRAFNHSRLGAAHQVNLRVRFAEVSRRNVHRLGVNWNAVGSLGSFAFGLLTGVGGPAGFLSGAGSFSSGNFSLDLLIDAMESEGLIHVLSEPTLTTVSGRPARFISGGEFAIPVPQGDGIITAQYRQYGVSLEFLPTVLPNGRIALDVKPEVSFPDDTVKAEIDGFSAPGLTVRNAETTVELGSGQTFAIAGLYERRGIDRDQKVPGLGDVPVAGNAFKNREQKRFETELVILITPYLVDGDSNDMQRTQATATSSAPSLGFMVR